MQAHAERRRSSSQSDATPRQGGLLQGGGGNSTPAGTAPSSDAVPPSADTPPKRLAFLPELLLSAASGSSALIQRSSPIPSQFLPVRSHSRAESTLGTIPREPSPSPTPMTATSGAQVKGHISPTKASSSRTYDSKLVSREMHRLGNLAHLPSLTPALSAAQSTVSLGMAPSAGSSMSSGSSGENPWASLHVHILPLFNGEPLRVPLEDLNQLVKRHVQIVVSASPSKALTTLEHDTSELLASGMVTLNAKLSGIEDEKLVARIVELWGFFWDQILPYVEGALLPLQTDPLLLSLYRMPKAHKANSPVTSQNGKGSISSLMLQSTPQIDVRTVALQSFRDRIILPLFPRLYARLTLPKEEAENPVLQQPRLQQMLLVLVSQHPQRAPTFSLTAPPPPPSAGEAAVQHLLRAVRAPLPHLQRASAGTGAPSFVADGLPRDRRGRIAQKYDYPADVDEEGGETPRIGGVGGVAFTSPRREKEFFDSLR
ncbi:HbrB-like-domain-containing protein [Sparassis latifolia]